MAKPLFAPSTLGTYQRQYDVLSEENDEDAVEIANVLKWMSEPTPDKKAEEKGAKNRLKELIDAGVELEQLDKISAFAALKNAKQKAMILDRLVDILKDIYYSLKDILSSNRVKTSLTILGSIAVGVGVGAALGTFVFPGIGTAIGGAVGAAITAGVAAVGGTVGLSILGGFLGSWLGKKIANKAFKHEKHFEVSKRITRKIKQRVGISTSVVQMINGFLYNRAKTIQSPACKKYYKSLRRLGILEASPTGMEKIALFFCNELMLLEKELRANKDSIPLRNEIQAVVFILKKLKVADGLSLSSKAKIAQTFKVYKEKQNSLPDVKMKQGVEFETVGDISPEVLAKSTGRFLDALPEDVKAIQTEFKQSKKSDAISYRHQIQTKDGVKLPDLVVKSTKDKRDHLLTMMTVKANQVTDENKEHLTKVIVARAKAHVAKGNKEVIILAAGNDDLAVELMVALKKGGLAAKLSEDEYPKKNKDAQLRVQKILARVNELTVPAPSAVSSLKRRFEKKPSKI